MIGKKLIKKRTGATSIRDVPDVVVSVYLSIVITIRHRRPMEGQDSHKVETQDRYLPVLPIYEIMLFS